MRVALALLVTLTSSFAQAQSCRSLQALDWLIGDWNAVNGLSLITESWSRVSSDSFEGEYMEVDASSGEPEAEESLRMVRMSGNIFYIAKVEQNEYPVAFKATSCSASGAVFENTEHDSPQRIEYKVVSATEFQALVSDGGDDGFVINFSRSN